MTDSRITSGTILHDLPSSSQLRHEGIDSDHDLLILILKVLESSNPDAPYVVL